MSFKVPVLEHTEEQKLETELRLMSLTRQRRSMGLALDELARTGPRW